MEAKTPVTRIGWLAAALVLPPVILVAAPGDTRGWLLTLGAALALSLLLIWVQAGVHRLARGRLAREIGLGFVLQPLALVALVSLVLLATWLASWLGATAAPTAPPLDPMTEGYQPLSWLAEALDAGFAGLIGLWSWLLLACGGSLLGVYFALLYPLLREWIGKQRKGQA